MTRTPIDFRGIPSLTGSPPVMDLSDLPEEPVALFQRWLDEALAARVPEPLAATVATVADDGLPDARTLILKAVDERGWAFAGTASSRKGRQLVVAPGAALDMWWQPVVRAIRVRGPVRQASTEECEADLAARSAEARAGVAPGEWRLWRIQPTRVEFWQGATDRQHLRIVYTRTDRWRRVITRGESEL